MKTIYFVRHGESTFNLEKRFAGWSDCPLTAKGNEQAREVSQRIKEFKKISKIVSSDLLRAYDTALAMGTTLNLPVTVDERLREVHLGDWEGLTMDDLERESSELLETWFSDPTQFRYPGGESIADMLVRVEDSIETHLKDCDTLLVVAHAGVIGNILAKWLVGDIRKSSAFNIRNAKIQKIVIDKEYSYLDILNG